MARVEVVTDIPADRIDQVETVYKADGAITQRIQTGSTYTLIATYPTKSKSFTDWSPPGAGQ